MSRDQRPGKVKLYSGSGNPVAGRAAPQGRNAATLPAPTVTASASALADVAEAPESAGSGGAWILVLLFILGSALGGGLFTAFVPF
jgi:hypothetical protein